MCRARLGCSAPKRFRGMQRTARTEQPPPPSRARTARHSGRPAVCSPAIQTRLAPVAGPPEIRQSSTSSTNPRGLPPVRRLRAVRAPSRRDRARCSRPTSRMPRRGSTEPTAAIEGVASSPIRNGRVGSIGMRRHRQRASHHAVISGTLLRQNCARFAPHAEGCWHFAATRRSILTAAAPTRDPRFNDFSLCVSVMPPLRRASSRRRLTSVGNPRVSSLRR